MRSEDEIKEKIHKIHNAILDMEDRLINKTCGARGAENTKICIHSLNQEICLLRWVLEPAGHQHSAGGK